MDWLGQIIFHNKQLWGIAVLGGLWAWLWVFKTYVSKEMLYTTLEQYLKKEEARAEFITNDKMDLKFELIHRDIAHIRQIMEEIKNEIKIR